MNKKWIECLIEIKKLIRNEGRTNFISPRELDELFVKYDVSLRELEAELSRVENSP